MCTLIAVKHSKQSNVLRDCSDGHGSPHQCPAAGAASTSAVLCFFFLPSGLRGVSPLDGLLGSDVDSMFRSGCCLRAVSSTQESQQAESTNIAITKKDGFQEMRVYRPGISALGCFSGEVLYVDHVCPLCLEYRYTLGRLSLSLQRYFIVPWKHASCANRAISHALREQSSTIPHDSVGRSGGGAIFPSYACV